MNVYIKNRFFPYPRKTWLFTIAFAGLLGIGGLSAQSTFTWNAHAEDWKNSANWIPAGGPPGEDDSVIFAPTPAINAIILESNFTVQDFTIEGRSQFTQIGTKSGGALRFTIKGDLLHTGTESEVLFRGSTRDNLSDVLSVHIHGNLRTSGGQALSFGQHREDTRMNYALNGLTVEGKTTIDDGGRIQIFTNGAVANFGEVEFGVAGANVLLLNQGSATDAFGSRFPPTRTVEVAGLSGGDGAASRVAVISDASLDGGETTLRLVGDGTFQFNGEILDRADDSAGPPLLSLEKSGAGVQVLAGENSWGRRTTVQEGGLLIDGSHRSSGEYTVDFGAWLGGKGKMIMETDTANIRFVPGAKLVFDPGYPLTVQKSNQAEGNLVNIDLGDLMPDGLVQRDGSAVDWKNIEDGIYPVISGTMEFKNLNTDWFHGIGDAEKDARFKLGKSGLELEVVPGTGKKSEPRVIEKAIPQSAIEASPQVAADGSQNDPQLRAETGPVETSAVVGSVDLVNRVDWPRFMADHDLVWTVTPRQWNEGGFTGNGQLGVMAYATLGDNRFDFHIGRSDVTDHRGAPDAKTSFGVKGRSVMFDFPRLELGRMALRPAGQIQSVTMRQDLWNAELQGTIKTDLGQLTFRLITHRDVMLNTIDVTSTEKNSDGSLAPWKWDFLAGDADSPRFQIIGRDRAPDYEQNPDPTLLPPVDGITIVEQRLLAGGCYATAWKEVPLGEGKGRLYLTTANELPPAGNSAPVAIQTIQDGIRAGFDELVEAHRAWWHAFYQRSFLTIPDPRLETFYWIQLYKFGAAAREDGPTVDLMGPWFKLTIWPGVWWNLNVQLTYWLPGMANHLDLSNTLINTMDNYWTGLTNRFINSKSLGDLAWVLHNYWLHYRFEGSWQPLAEKWLPKANEVLESYRGMLEEDEEGRLNLKPMGSPEFHGFENFRNTNYNLALLRWLIRSVNQVSEHTGTGAETAAEWQAIEACLIAPPVDEFGFMVGSEQSLDESQRHHSHLIGYFPLFIFDDDDPEMNALLRKSIYHWLNITNADGRRDRTGFTQVLAASMVAALGDGEEAVALLNGLLDNDLGNTIHGSKVMPNTFYMEANGRYPTIESPFAAASATIELLLQSPEGQVRIFPAVPQAWKAAAFYQLRAQGGFLVSAERKGGRTAWVVVESLAGEPLVLRVADWNEPIVARAAREIEITSRGNGEFAVGLQQGEKVLLFPASSPVTEAVVSPLPRQPGEVNFFGVNPGNQLNEDKTHPNDKPKSLMP